MRFQGVDCTNCCLLGCGLLMCSRSAWTFQSNLRKNESLTSKMKVAVSFDGFGTVRMKATTRRHTPNSHNCCVRPVVLHLVFQSRESVKYT